jgi:hypothetical protein
MEYREIIIDPCARSISMDESPMLQMPTIDLSAKSLLLLSQLGFFACMAFWFGQDLEDTSDYLFPALFALSGLALFLSVPHSRMGVTLGIPAFMVVMGLATGETDTIFFAVFFLLMFGPIAYMPALASGDSTLGLEDDDRKMRLGIVWLAFTLLMVFMMSSMVPAAMDGEWTEEDFDETDYTMTIDSTEQTIAQVGLAAAVIGVVVFLLTALVGVEIGPMLPWHGGAIVAASMVIGQYLWLVADGGPDYNLASEVIFLLSLVGIIALPPCIAYGSHED